MPLYNKLKEYRAKIDVNQQEMGQLVGVSRQTISQIERVFDVPVEEIFTWVEEEENKDAGAGREGSLRHER